MKYDKKEYSKLRVPVNKAQKGEDLFKKFPDLTLHQEFKDLKEELPQKISFQKVFTFIVLSYDKNSPFVRYNNNFKKRVLEAAQDAQFPIGKDGWFTEEYAKIVRGNSHYQGIINRAIISYCRMLNDSHYSQMVAFEASRHKNNLILLDSDGITASDEAKIIEIINTTTKYINEYSMEFFSNSEHDSVYEELLEEIHNENLELSPEQLTFKRGLRDRLLQSANPYGDWVKDFYKPEDLEDKEYNDMKKEMANDTEEARKIFEAQGREVEMERIIQRQTDMVNSVLQEEENRRNGKKN